MGGNTRSIDHLTTPDINLNFRRNEDGTYSVTIPTNRSGNESQYPLLQALMKDKETLQGAIENVLLADGVPYQISPFKFNLSGESGGKLTGGGEVGGGGKVKGIVDLSGKLDGAAEAGGKVAGGVEFQLELGRGGLSMERQGKLQDLLDSNVEAFCLQWAKDHPKGTSIPLPGGDVLKVPAKVVEQYIEAHDPQKKAEKLLEDLRDGMKKLNPFAGADAGAAVGFASPEHPYHRMYIDALTRIGEMTPRPGGDQKPETLAAALVQSAAESRFDPDKPIVVANGRESTTLFAIQGDPGDPASRRVHIDASAPVVPTAERIAQLQAPVRDDLADQLRQPSPTLRA